MDNVQGVPLGSVVPKVVISTDASLHGWGAVCGHQTTKGVWGQSYQDAHINILEMKAVLLALRHFQEQIQGKAVLIQSDNTTVVAYILKDGGMRSPSMNALVKELVQWSLRYHVTVTAVHVAGADNVQADSLSRDGLPFPRDILKSTEWSLLQSVADRIFQRWGRPDVDLFATRRNRKVACFCSCIPEHLALSQQALSIPWDQGLIYLYPPLSLALRSLAKVAREEANAIVILPAWPRRGWYHLLMQLTVEPPILLPTRRNLLQGPRGERHPDLGSLRLAAWRVSGETSKQREFQSKLQVPAWLLCDLPQKGFIRRNGAVLYAGANAGTRIPFTHL